MSLHPFDPALEPTPGGDPQPGTWRGTSSPAGCNRVGPFGSITAVTAIQAILPHPALLGKPIALTANEAGASTQRVYSRP